MTLRTTFFWLHLTAGVVAGIIVFVMSVTGVALTYERQLIKWSDREFKSTPNSSANGCRWSAWWRSSAGSSPTRSQRRSRCVGPTRAGGRGRGTTHRLRGRLLRAGAGRGEPGRQACAVAAARLAPVAGGGRARGARRRARSPAGPTCCSWGWWRRGFTCGSRAGGRGRRSGGVLVQARRARQGARLQLAQRDRHLVGCSAADRRGQRGADFVSVGQRPRLPHGRRGTASAARRWPGWRSGRSCGRRAAGVAAGRARRGSFDGLAGFSRAPSSRSRTGGRSTSGCRGPATRRWCSPSIAGTAGSRTFAPRSP